MLRRRIRELLSFALLLGSVLTGAGPAGAAESPPGGSVGECANQTICVGAEDPGSPGSTPTGGSGGSGGGGGGGGTQTCSWAGHQYPCYDPDLGSFSNADGCYYKKEDPQPPADDPSWDGHDPSTGAVYDKTCRSAVDGTITGATAVWLAEPPVAAPPPDPGQLFIQAKSEIQFVNVPLHSAPGPNGTPLVGMPVWLWIKTVEATKDGRLSKSAGVPGIKVTATATLESVDWDMADGSTLEHCTGPGIPYESGQVQTYCSHRYTRSSAGQSNDRYPISATLHWKITPTVEGAEVHIDPIPYDTNSQVLQLRVSEAQVLN